MYVCMYVWSHIPGIYKHSKSKDQPGKVANPAPGQLNREINRYEPLCCIFLHEKRGGEGKKIQTLTETLSRNFSCFQKEKMPLSKPLQSFGRGKISNMRFQTFPSCPPRISINVSLILLL